MDNLVEIPGCFFAYKQIFPAYTSTMKLWTEIAYDFDLIGPKITATDKVAIIENIKKVILISDASVTVDTGRFYVSVKGKDFSIGEIWEGRMELEGKIEGIEFYKALGTDSH